MVYQLNIQTMPLIRRSHLIVRSPVAAFAAWIWSITGANVNVDLAYTMFGRVKIVIATDDLKSARAVLHET